MARERRRGSRVYGPRPSDAYSPIGIGSATRWEARRWASRSRSRTPLNSRGDHRAFPDGYAEKNRVFVGGVPKVTTLERFRNYFETFGATTEVTLNADRSFGFITCLPGVL